MSAQFSSNLDLSNIGYTIYNYDGTVNQARTTSGITNYGNGQLSAYKTFETPLKGKVIWDDGNGNTAGEEINISAGATVDLTPVTTRLVRMEETYYPPDNYSIGKIRDSIEDFKTVITNIDAPISSRMGNDFTIEKDDRIDEVKNMVSKLHNADFSEILLKLGKLQNTDLSKVLSKIDEVLESTVDIYDNISKLENTDITPIDKKLSDESKNIINSIEKSIETVKQELSTKASQISVDKIPLETVLKDDDRLSNINTPMSDLKTDLTPIMECMKNKPNINEIDDIKRVLEVMNTPKEEPVENKLDRLAVKTENEMKMNKLAEKLNKFYPLLRKGR